MTLPDGKSPAQPDPPAVEVISYQTAGASQSRVGTPIVTVTLTLLEIFFIFAAIGSALLICFPFGDHITLAEQWPAVIGLVGSVNGVATAYGLHPFLITLRRRKMRITASVLIVLSFLTAMSILAGGYDTHGRYLGSFNFHPPEYLQAVSLTLPFVIVGFGRAIYILRLLARLPLEPISSETSRDADNPI